MNTHRMNTLSGIKIHLFIIIGLMTFISSCSEKDDTGETPEEPVIPGSYTFTTTNFDDGWTSTVKEDWVEVVKDNIKVQIHYPKEGTIIPADPEPLIVNAWNILIAPRYTNIKNFKIAETIHDYNRAYFASANLTDSAGNEVYVAIFRKGDTGWLEFITPDKNTFVNYFGINIDQITWESDLNIYAPLVKMAGYNRFAVAQADLPGKWSNNFASNTFYVNIYTGWSEGMSTYTSSVTFEFASKSYNWSLAMANSGGGFTSVISAKSSGSYTVINNWQISCSDIDGNPKTYNAYFSCIKGARILWLEDASYPTGYTAYGRIN